MFISSLFDDDKMNTLARIEFLLSIKISTFMEASLILIGVSSLIIVIFFNFDNSSSNIPSRILLGIIFPREFDLLSVNSINSSLEPVELVKEQFSFWIVV